MYRLSYRQDHSSSLLIYRCSLVRVSNLKNARVNFEDEKDAVAANKVKLENKTPRTISKGERDEKRQ